MNTASFVMTDGTFNIRIEVGAINARPYRYSVPVCLWLQNNNATPLWLKLQKLKREKLPLKY
jgi:hypothetical protein